MSLPPTDAPLPPSLRVLKGLVLVLTLTMIVAVITVVWLLVTRMPAAFAPPAPHVPEDLALPEGAVAQAVTFGQGWMAVVTTDGRFLMFDAAGTLTREVTLDPAP